MSLCRMMTAKLKDARDAAAVRRAVFSAYGLAVLLVNLVMVDAAMGEERSLRILALGDSLTAGYNLPQDAAFPVRLEQRLREHGLDVTVINAGVSGDTSAGGLARLDWALADDPDGVIVELGANDGLRGIDPEATQRNLDAIISRLKDRGIGVLLTGMLAPPNMGREYTEAFKTVFPALAEKHDVAFYPFFLEGVAGDPSLNLDDGIHPTAEGVDVIVENILPTVLDWIGSLREAAEAKATP